MRGKVLPHNPNDKEIWNGAFLGFMLVFRFLNLCLFCFGLRAESIYRGGERRFRELNPILSEATVEPIKGGLDSQRATAQNMLVYR